MAIHLKENKGADLTGNDDYLGVINTFILITRHRSALGNLFNPPITE